MAAGDNHTNQECTDYAAVNRHSPFPGVPDRGKIVLILVPGENYKVQPRADNAADQAAQHDVDQLVGVDAKAFGVPKRHQHRQQDADRDDHAVPGDPKTADLQRSGIDVKLQSKFGKLTVCIEICTFLTYEILSAGMDDRQCHTRGIKIGLQPPGHIFRCDGSQHPIDSNNPSPDISAPKRAVAASSTSCSVRSIRP